MWMGLGMGFDLPLLKTAFFGFVCGLGARWVLGRTTSIAVGRSRVRPGVAPKFGPAWLDGVLLAFFITWYVFSWPLCLENSVKRIVDRGLLEFVLVAVMFLVAFILGWRVTMRRGRR